MRLNFLWAVKREIEVAGHTKDFVLPSKEYGTFVEFNGGHRDLLHFTEPSYEQESLR
ncbi:hypothetical protein ACP70R_031325 [Stipagrostis hirtigluma subsp. patula]